MGSRDLVQRVLTVCLIFVGSVTLGIGVVLLTGGNLGALQRNQTDSAVAESPAVTPESVSTPRDAATALPEPSPSPAEQAAVSPTGTDAATTETQAADDVHASQPAATATTQPTASPTQAPATATTAPTPTTAATATPTAETIAAEPFLEDTFDDPRSGWPVREETTWSSGYIDGQYVLTINGRPAIGVSIPVQEENYRLSVDVLTSDEGEAGLIVATQEPSTFYLLALRPDGTYALQRLEREALTNIVEWTNSTALRPGAGVANRISLERRGAAIRFFANEQLLTEWTAPEGATTNRFGFMLTSPTGQGTARFDNFVGEVLPDA